VAYVENVDLADIYARDGGVCQICHERVDRRCRYPHPRTPVLDHIVPLARGGLHESRNVQLAHHGCNNAKNARAVGSQLRLVG
jgi:5-methylcytosine-specific restriction endonuclease McrA